MPDHDGVWVWNTLWRGLGTIRYEDKKYIRTLFQLCLSYTSILLEIWHWWELGLSQHDSGNQRGEQNQQGRYVFVHLSHLLLSVCMPRRGGWMTKTLNPFYWVSMRPMRLRPFATSSPNFVMRAFRWLTKYWWPSVPTAYCGLAAYPSRACAAREAMFNSW